MALIGELSKTNVEKLMHFYIDNTDNAVSLLNNIFSKYPKIKSPIFSPVFLKIVCSLCNGEEGIHNIVNSVSTFYEVLLKRYGSTSHNASEFDVNENSILRELSSLAYRKTMVEETFQILPGDLSKLNLTQNEVQDFVTVCKYTGDRCSLVYRFTSQSFQEFLCARFAWLHLEDCDFLQCLKLLFPDVSREHDLVKYDKFSTIRLFFMSYTSLLKSEKKFEKKKDAFFQKCANFFIDNKKAESILDDEKTKQLNEINENTFIKKFRSKLEEVNFKINFYGPQLNQNLLVFMSKFLPFVKELKVSGFNVNQLNKLLTTLSNSKIKIENLLLRNIAEVDNETTRLIVKCVYRTSKCFFVMFDGKISFNKLIPHCQRFYYEITNVDTGNLCTNEIIEVKVCVEMDSCSQLLIDAKLQQGMVTQVSLGPLLNIPNLKQQCGVKRIKLGSEVRKRSKTLGITSAPDNTSVHENKPSKQTKNIFFLLFTVVFFCLFSNPMEF